MHDNEVFDQKGIRRTLVKRIDTRFKFTLRGSPGRDDERHRNEIYAVNDHVWAEARCVLSEVTYDDGKNQAVVTGTP